MSGSAVVLAGCDVGNATTEVVVGERVDDVVRVIGAERAPTRRGKGSAASMEGAARLVRRLERRHDVRVDQVVAAPLRPVDTRAVTLPEESVDTGRLRVVSSGVGTAGGDGFGAGRPVLLGDAADGDAPVVVVVPAGSSYGEVAAAVDALNASGRVRAVVLENDEAVLVANRLSSAVPVIDEVPVGPLRSADLLAVEVSAAGRPLQVMTDPLKLRAALDLEESELTDAAHLAAQLFDATNALVAVGPPGAVEATEDGWIELVGQGRLPFLRGREALAGSGVGAARAYAVPPDLWVEDVDDLWAVDLAAVAGAVQARRASARARPVGIAGLRSASASVDPAEPLSALLGVPATTVCSEAAAARTGALSTPGAGAGTVVVDLGGGTIDAIGPHGEVVAAGAGDLITSCVATLTGSTTAAAEWVKRGPAHRVDAPQVLLAEDGARRFLDRPAARETVGSLVVDGPAGLLPFSRTMAPGEWRALRLRLKVDLVGGNVARALRTLGSGSAAVLVVGGSAGDEEVLAAVAGALPPGTVVARGNVGGSLGHRYAVAYGLLLTG